MVWGVYLHMPVVGHFVLHSVLIANLARDFELVTIFSKAANIFSWDVR